MMSNIRTIYKGSNQTMLANAENNNKLEKVSLHKDTQERRLFDSILKVICLQNKT